MELSAILLCQRRGQRKRQGYGLWLIDHNEVEYSLDKTNRKRKATHGVKLLKSLYAENQYGFHL